MTETPHTHHFTIILALPHRAITCFPEPGPIFLLAELTEVFLREECDLPQEEAVVKFTDYIERGHKREYHIHIATTKVPSLDGRPLATAFLKALREKGHNVPHINVYLQTPQGKVE